MISVNSLLMLKVLMVNISSEQNVLKYVAKQIRQVMVLMKLLVNELLIMNEKHNDEELQLINNQLMVFDVLKEDVWLLLSVEEKL
jgi:hypothetical protein